MKKALICIVALSCAVLWAQEEKKPAAQWQVRVFTVKSGNTIRVRNAVQLISDSVSYDDVASIVVVRAAPEYIPAIEKLVKELDGISSGDRNVESTFYILQGSREPIPGAPPLTPDLEPTVTQLKALFGFQGFRVFDTAVIRGRDGQEANVTGNFTVGDRSANYSLRLRPSIVGDTKPRTVRIDRLFYNGQLVGAPGAAPTSVRIESNIDVKEGQKVVVGKGGIDGNQSAIILVCSSRIVE